MTPGKSKLLTRRPLTAFFALSILLFLPLFAAAGVAVMLEAPAWLQYLTQALSSWSPTFAALTVTSATGGRAGVRKLLGGFQKWRVRPVWYGVAILVPLTLSIVPLQTQMAILAGLSFVFALVVRRKLCLNTGCPSKQV